MSAGRRLEAALLEAEAPNRRVASRATVVVVVVVVDEGAVGAVGDVAPAGEVSWAVAWRDRSLGLWPRAESVRANESLDAGRTSRIVSRPQSGRRSRMAGADGMHTAQKEGHDCQDDDDYDYANAAVPEARAWAGREVALSC